MERYRHIAFPSGTESNRWHAGCQAHQARMAGTESSNQAVKLGLEVKGVRLCSY
jgi:hypothetical protein